MTTLSIRRAAIVAGLVASAFVGSQAIAQNTTPTVPKPTDPHPSNPVSTAAKPASINAAGDVAPAVKSDNKSMSSKDPSTDTPKP